MGKERGERTKKIMHIGHVILEFLKHVLKAFGKPDKAVKSASKSADKIATNTGDNVGKTAGKVTDNAAKSASKSATSKSGVMATKSVASVLGGTGAGASSSGLTAAAGIIISVKTLAVILIACSVFFGGLTTYSYINHENPLNLLGDLFGNHNSGGPHNNNAPPTNNHDNTQTTLTPIPTITTATAIFISPIQITGQSSSQSPSPSQNVNTSNDTGYDPRYDNGTTPPSFNYTVPDDPLGSNDTLGLIMNI
jgi:hypothetical protein